MADVKDILGMPRASDKTEVQPKPKEQRAKRPEGMSREAFALLDGSHPIVPSSFVSDMAKKQVSNQMPGLQRWGRCSSSQSCCI